MKRAASAVFVLLAASAFGAVDLSFVSDGPIVPGEWNSNYLEGMAYADAHNIPVFSIYGATDCGNTKAYVLAVQKDDVRAWIRRHPVVLLCTCAPSETLSGLKFKSQEDSADPDLWAARRWCKEHAPSMDYPIAGLHWLKPDGKAFDFAYIGRSSQIPRMPGFGYSGLVSELTVRLLEHYFGSYVPDGPYEPSDPEPKEESDFGTREISCCAAVCDAETGLPEAAVTLKAKKANSLGRVPVSGSAVTSEGRKYSVKATADMDDPHVEAKAGSLGKLVVDFGPDGIEPGGTLGGAPLEAVGSVGGTLPCAEAVFSFSEPIPGEIDGYSVVREALPTNVAFASGRNPWALPKKGSVTWSASAKTVVVKGDNPSGLKLSYTPLTGYFKGEFHIYGVKEKTSSKTGLPSGCTIKKWKVSISGLVVDGEGWGRASAKALGGWFPVRVRARGGELED